MQKFGGTSVVNSARKFVYEKIEEKAKKYKVVVVISAMGRSGDTYATDTLLNLAKSENEDVNNRELDLIYSCGEIISSCIISANLQKRYKVATLTGIQGGILTDSNFTDAKIISIDENKILSLFEDNDIVVIAGSQGADEFGNITSLGRGGSDITAIALGAKLKAVEIEIYSDVAGIMTADPFKVKDAKLIQEISYEDCINIVENSEKKVMHPRSIYMARDSGIELIIKSTFCNEKGTKVFNCKKEEFYVSCICDSIVDDVGVITVVGNRLEGYTEKIKELDIPFKEVKGDDKVIKIMVDKDCLSKTLMLVHNMAVN